MEKPGEYNLQNDGLIIRFDKTNDTPRLVEKGSLLDLSPGLQK